MLKCRTMFLGVVFFFVFFSFSYKLCPNFSSLFSYPIQSNLIKITKKKTHKKQKLKNDPWVDFQSGSKFFVTSPSGLWNQFIRFSLTSTLYWSFPYTWPSSINDNQRIVIFLFVSVEWRGVTGAFNSLPKKASVVTTVVSASTVVVVGIAPSV